jgi:hypothetical protein
MSADFYPTTRHHIKRKVKFTLKQAMKAQTGSRDIILLLL